MLKICFAALSAAGVLVLASCSGNTDSVNAGSGSAGGQFSINGLGGTGHGGNGTTVVGSGSSAGTGNECTIKDDGSGCAGEAYEPEVSPLEIYVMFDQSGSMCTCVEPLGAGSPCDAVPDPACKKTRLDAIREATAEFLADQRSTGIGVGIGYFGSQPFGSASCNVADYSNAAVPFGTLPAHGANIMQSLNGIKPTGETPTGAAVRGACGYAQQRKKSQPGHEVVILLLTDGRPEAPITCQGGSGSCCPTLDDTVAAAKACRDADVGIKTYVLGVGPFLQNLEQIAVAGGTEKAYLVEGGEVSKNVLQALNAIRNDAAIPCEFKLPPPPSGETLDLDRVNITYASPACEPTFFSRVAEQATCDTTGGWYYDNPADPQSIHLCPTSCDQVGVPGGRLLFTVGCATRVDIR